MNNIRKDKGNQEEGEMNRRRKERVRRDKRKRMEKAKRK